MIDDVIARDTLPTALTRVEPVKAGQASQPTVQVEHANSAVDASSVDREGLEQTVAKLRESIGHLNSSLRIEIDPDTDRVVVKILDDRSGEVIRQIPSQEMVEIAKRLDAMQAIFLTKRT